MKHGPVIIYLICLGADTSRAQWWSDGGLPADGANYLILNTDSASTTMFAMGNVVDHFGTPEQAMYYYTYHDGFWSGSEPFDHFVLTSIVFHDTLYVGGIFNSVDGIPISHIARHVNGQWSAAGTFDNAIYRLKELNGELYAIGDFIYADGELCQGIAKRTGDGWQPTVPVGCDNCSLKDIEMYNDELYISGTITFPNDPYLHVMYLHDDAWLPVGGQGIFGALSAGGPLAVYNGDLYLGGAFQLSDGNAGDAIMRWNGTAWSAVGSGVQDETGGYSQLIRVDDLEVHDGLLFASGGFTYAGNIPANRIATWNGSEWCSVGGDFGEWAVNSIAFLNDTLFAACWDVADGLPVNHLAKFIAPAYEGNCSVPMQTAASAHMHHELQALGGSRYRLSGHAGTSTGILIDATGRSSAVLNIRDELPFELPACAPGTYLLRIAGGGSYRLFVQP